MKKTKSSVEGLSPVALRRHREHEEHRRAVLEAAERVFAQKGFAGASIAEIAAEAQFSVGSVYNFFSGKKALGEAVMLRIAAERISGVEALSAQTFASSHDAVDAFAEVWLRHYERHGAFLRAGVEERRGPKRADLPAELVALLRAYEQTGEAFFEKVRMLGGMADRSAHDLFDIAEGVCLRALFQSLRPWNPVDPLAKIRSLLSILFR